MARSRDLPFEALAEATSTDWEQGRGELNKALAQIKDQFEGDDLSLALEIEERAKLYRRVFQGAALTPTALAKHWLRVFEESMKQREQMATNVSAPYHECDTCGGHRFVIYSTRPLRQTYWQKRHEVMGKGPDGRSVLRNRPAPDAAIEEYAPCPACSPDIDASFRRYDGKIFRPPDPEQVRERIRK